MMTDLPTFLIAATADDWTLQRLRTIGIGYWEQLKTVSNDSQTEVEAIKNIHICIEPIFDRPVLVSSPPYRGIDGAEGFAYVRYLIEHYQDRGSAEWKLVEQHLERVIKNAQDVANRQELNELREKKSEVLSNNARQPRNKLVGDAIDKILKDHSDQKKAAWFFPHIIQSQLEQWGANPRFDDKADTIWYTERGKEKPLKRKAFENRFYAKTQK